MTRLMVLTYKDNYQYILFLGNFEYMLNLYKVKFCSL